MTSRATLLPLLILLACAGAAEDPRPARTLVATATAGGLEVDLLAAGRLETGRSPVFLAVRTVGGDPVADATVSFEPLMQMDGYVHGAPVLGAPALEADGVYRCEVVFQMSTVAGGTWGATVEIARPGAAPVEVNFPSLPVADSGRARTFAHTDPRTATVTGYVASLNLDAGARVGLNPVTATLHRMDGATAFTPVEGAALHLDPQMPSMGHGSPGSVDPTAAGPGVYRGKLSLSMPGEWEITMTVAREGTTLGSPRFTLTF